VHVRSVIAVKYGELGVFEPLRISIGHMVVLFREELEVDRRNSLLCYLF
jgi:hypothetical protein